MKKTVTITFINNRTITYELFDVNEEVANLLSQAIKTKKLDDMKVERVVPGFVFQPWYDESTKDEFLNRTITNTPNDIPFVRGSVGLAGDGDQIACPSCIFIALGEEKTKRLNGTFMNIGKVIAGFETLDYLESLELRRIENEEKVEIYEPKEELIISTVTISD